MKRTPIHGSNHIKSIGHEGNTLEVEFAGGGIYHYHDVPLTVHTKLMSTHPYVGKNFDSHIKKAGFQYTKVK